MLKETVIKYTCEYCKNSYDEEGEARVCEHECEEANCRHLDTRRYYDLYTGQGTVWLDTLCERCNDTLEQIDVSQVAKSEEFLQDLALLVYQYKGNANG